MILFHDIDGCMNAECGNPLPMGGRPLSALQIKRLAELGQAFDNSLIDIVVLNTGRSLQDTLTIAKALQCTSLRYLAAEHGACIVEYPSLTSIEWTGEKRRQLELIGDLVNWFEQQGLVQLSAQLGTEARMLNKTLNVTIETPDSISGEELTDRLKHFIDSCTPFDLSGFVFHNSAFDGYVDIMPQIHKGDAVEKIQQSFPHVQTVALGNGLNDLPMMSVADICVCPRNAESDVIDHVRNNSGYFATNPFIDGSFEWLHQLASNDDE